VFCKGQYGTPFSTTINRAVRLGKTRNGPGSGMDIGFIFDGKTLRFSEQGPIESEDDRGGKIEVVQPNTRQAPRAPVVAAPVEFDVEDLPS
jgi:hypothetical protein